MAEPGFELRLYTKNEFINNFQAFLSTLNLSTGILNIDNWSLCSSPASILSRAEGSLAGYIESLFKNHSAIGHTFLWGFV